MAYDELLSMKFRDALEDRAGVTEKRMMGGICFFLDGNMIGGVDRTKSGEGRFMFRVGKDNEGEALRRPGAVIVEQGGRRMGGLIFVDERVCDAAALEEWIALALSFVRTLPPKRVDAE
jgi:TfoX/Sxy family transcriptional regulator of competence genes